ncbi:MAG TPA: DegT/DnrJ/EryC1/StrS family aminotransferase, partial [Sphingomicrobium sp.]|nr:DegT/DnrJ/EryC1/StrS family aminotransferase [Sphingomicrobium sp.]
MTEAATLMEPGFLIFGKPDIGQAEKDAVLDVLDSGWLSTGPKVEAFEEAFRAHLGSGYPVAVSSCTDGLILSLVASGVGPGDEVVTSPLTFAATVNAIVAVGAR